MSHVHSFQRVTRDILDLAELQWQLLSVDSQAARTKLVRALILSAVAATLATSALTVLIAGLGLALHDLSELPIGLSLLIAATVVFVIVGVMLWIALKSIQSAGAAIAETKSEFGENLRGLKATLVSPSTSPRNQIRAESFATNDLETSSTTYQRNPSHTYQ
ncbi:phage holin family protein [Neorhodopirellula pilleata]|uniref:Phage holin family protein n=1 Tax=Neorhodopirellula pilleata TaxID=2714738 RepID=A0A5C6AU04_9BACT|nr:phage holin family protein [Neorhodopirellula pilleata]TWU03220.1 hypothetical protein Pla100_01380 [Neorhodopirellula pilleata]